MTDPTPVPVPPLVSGEELLVAAALPLVDECQDLPDEGEEGHRQS